MTVQRGAYEALLAHALKKRPQEACGLLGGTEGCARTFYPCANAAKSPVFFRIEPKEIFRALRDMEAAGESLCGIFHSHPHTEAFPSDADRLHFHYPGTLYLILSLRGDGPKLRAFSLDGPEVEEQPLAVEAP